MSEEAEVLALASQRVGTLLHGKYHLDGVLGVGGMATVYAATHRNRKRFAVKMLHPELSVRKELRARFVREGYVANSVAHPGVVELVDDDVDETGSAFLVMELLEGATVDALYTAGAPIPVPEALGIICQLLEVLEAAHQKAVVHRDIKPGNLFILRDGRLKVLDFGIARLRESDSGLKSTRTGAMLGTPAFMAPEQALATPDAVDARTDIWGAGATLFTMLSACFVHHGENARQIMIHAATEPARSIESVMPDLPTAVVAIVARALAFERADRWQSAAEMRTAVLETYRQLFGSDPVRADIAELLARTSAALGSQPTEPQPFTEGDQPGSGLRVSLQTTASTPVATRPPPPRPTRRRAQFFLVSGVALLAIPALIALRPGAKGSASPTSAAVTGTVDTTRVSAPPSPASTPNSLTPTPMPAPPAAASSERPFAGAAASAFKGAPPSTSTRTALPRAAAPASAAPGDGPIAASRAPENPLQLDLLQ